MIDYDIFGCDSDADYGRLIDLFVQAVRYSGNTTWAMVRNTPFGGNSFMFIVKTIDLSIQAQGKHRKVLTKNPFAAGDLACRPGYGQQRACTTHSCCGGLPCRPSVPWHGFR
jgi:hypothetical protein